MSYHEASTANIERTGRSASYISNYDLKRDLNYPISGDRSIVLTAEFTPSAGDLWHQPGVHQAEPRRAFAHLGLKRISVNELAFAQAVIKGGSIY